MSVRKLYQEYLDNSAKLNEKSREIGRELNKLLPTLTTKQVIELWLIEPSYLLRPYLQEAWPIMLDIPVPPDRERNYLDLAMIVRTQNIPAMIKQAIRKGKKGVAIILANRAMERMALGIYNTGGTRAGTYYAPLDHQFLGVMEMDPYQPAVDLLPDFPNIVQQLPAYPAAFLSAIYQAELVHSPSLPLLLEMARRDYA